MNSQRNYAHEVLTDVMHNQVPALVTAQRARDQAEYLREENAKLRAALAGLFEHCSMIHKHWGAGNNSIQADNAVNVARAALAQSGGQS